MAFTYSERKGRWSPFTKSIILLGASIKKESKNIGPATTSSDLKGRAATPEALWRLPKMGFEVWG
jgi:hypothetical protein